MNNISIVTAFFDIGRGDWTPDKGLPHYLQRSTDTYLERFSHMAELENEMVVFTSQDMVDTINELREDRPTSIIVMDFKESFSIIRHLVSTVQQNAEYQAKINPMQVRNPEYWNADYVVVNAMKSSFVVEAIRRKMISNDLVAWLDFGYCRDESTLNGVSNWTYPFDKEKIHFFNIKDWTEGTYIQDVIANNDVHITGPCIVAGHEGWRILQRLVAHNMDELIKNNLVDDDQTLLLMSYLAKPELFELHKVSADDWFVAFKEYNETVS
jgi:protein YibB